jgi:hypothetical protein
MFYVPATEGFLYPLPGGAKQVLINKFFEGVGLSKRKFEMPAVFAFFAAVIGKQSRPSSL